MVMQGSVCGVAKAISGRFPTTRLRENKINTPRSDTSCYEEVTVFPKSFPGEKSNQFFRVRVVKRPPNLPRRVHDVERPLVSPYETTSAMLFVESAWGLVEGEEGEKAKAFRAAKSRFAAEK
jgi:hypothetical protein